MECTFIQLSDIVIIISSNINLSLTYGPHSNQFYNQMRLMKIKNLAFAFQAWRFKKTHVYNYGQHNYFKSVVF